MRLFCVHRTPVPKVSAVPSGAVDGLGRSESRHIVVILASGPTRMNSASFRWSLVRKVAKLLGTSWTVRWRRWTCLDWKTSTRTTRWLPLHLQRSTATHIITHTHCVQHAPVTETPTYSPEGAAWAAHAVTLDQGTCFLWDPQSGSDLHSTFHATPPRETQRVPLSTTTAVAAVVLSCTTKRGLCWRMWRFAFSQFLPSFASRVAF